MGKGCKVCGPEYDECEDRCECCDSHEEHEQRAAESMREFLADYRPGDLPESWPEEQRWRTENAIMNAKRGVK